MIALVANQPYPYRNSVYDLMGKDFVAIYSCKCEPNRVWSVDKLNHGHIFLHSFFIPYGTEFYYHINFDIFRALNKVNPDTVILYGFGITQQLALLWCKMKKRDVVLMADCWKWTERNRSWRQIKIQKWFVNSAKSIIVPSIRGKEYFEYLGGENIFISHLCVDNDKYRPDNEKEFDLIYVSQFVDRKCPMFVAEVMKKLPGKSILIIGDGELREKFLDDLWYHYVKYCYLTPQKFEDMPKHFKRAKLCLMPTRDDMWGLVANEACAAGVPVFTTDKAGCAGELIQYLANGRILPLDSNLWSSEILFLLNNKALRESMSDYCIKSVKNYTKENAVEQIRRACEV